MVSSSTCLCICIKWFISQMTSILWLLPWNSSLGSARVAGHPLLHSAVLRSPLLLFSCYVWAPGCFTCTSFYARSFPLPPKTWLAALLNKCSQPEPIFLQFKTVKCFFSRSCLRLSSGPGQMGAQEATSLCLILLIHKRRNTLDPRWGPLELWHSPRPGGP